MCVWDGCDLKGKGLAQKKEEGTRGWEGGRWWVLVSSPPPPSQSQLHSQRRNWALSRVGLPFQSLETPGQDHSLGLPSYRLRSVDHLTFKLNINLKSSSGYGWSENVLIHHSLPLYQEVKCNLLSHVRFFVTPWTVARQAPLSMGFSRQGY